MGTPYIFHIYVIKCGSLGMHFLIVYFLIYFTNILNLKVEWMDLFQTKKCACF